MRDVHLAELAEVPAVGVDDSRRVVINAGEIFLVHRHDQHDVVLPSNVAHEPRRRTVRHLLGQLIPSRFLLGTEVRTVKQLLQTDAPVPPACAAWR